MNAAPANVQLEIAKEVAKFYADPLGFVRFAYPWKQPGPLADCDGPDAWQRDTLNLIGTEVRNRRFDGSTAVKPIRIATASGHGIGKSVLSGWLVDWIMSTRPYAQGTVTANTYAQLSTKTWARVKFWTRLCITSSWFIVNNEKMYRIGYADSWFCTPQTCREENSESFHGQHAADSTSFYIADEASAIPEKIWEVMEGGLTDGEPMIFAFGNATRSEGQFHRAIFGAERNNWIHQSIDSRTCKMANKELIQEWVDLYGEDSDFVRVRVRGLPPRASEAQFIDMQRILDAQKRQVCVDKHEPLVCGVDMAWGGDDDNVIRFRCGLDARCLPPIRIKGEFTRDPAVMVNRLADLLKQKFNVHGVEKTITRMFIDSAGIAGPVGHRLREMGFDQRILEINFGADSPHPQCAYMRDYMWDRMKQWLLVGAIDSDSGLEADLVAPGVVTDRLQRVKLESKQDIKKRGCDSTDDADALALTFAVQEPIEAPLELLVSEKLAAMRDQYGRSLLITDAIIARQQIARRLRE